MELIIKTWADFKNLCIISKGLTNQYVDIGSSYRLVGPDSNGINWQYDLPKLIDGSANPDATEFENNYMASFNQSLIIRAGVGRPARVSISPQPANTYNKWKGFQAIVAPGMTYSFVDLSWPATVYFRGGHLYSNFNDENDYISADVLMNPTDQMLMPNMIQNVHTASGVQLSFLSDESMAFPTYMKLRVHCYCPNGLSATEIKYFNILTEFFQ